MTDERPRSLDEHYRYVEGLEESLRLEKMATARLEEDLERARTIIAERDRELEFKDRMLAIAEAKRDHAQRSAERSKKALSIAAEILIKADQEAAAEQATRDRDVQRDPEAEQQLLPVPAVVRQGPRREEE